MRELISPKSIHHRRQASYTTWLCVFQNELRTSHMRQQWTTLHTQCEREQNEEEDEPWPNWCNYRVEPGAAENARCNYLTSQLCLMGIVANFSNDVTDVNGFKQRNWCAWMWRRQGNIHVLLHVHWDCQAALASLCPRTQTWAASARASFHERGASSRLHSGLQSPLLQFPLARNRHRKKPHHQVDCAFLETSRVWIVRVLFHVFSIVPQ